MTENWVDWYFLRDQILVHGGDPCYAEQIAVLDTLPCGPKHYVKDIRFRDVRGVYWIDIGPTKNLSKIALATHKMMKGANP